MSLDTDVDACPNPPPSVLPFCESYVKKIKMPQSASMIRAFKIDVMNEVDDTKHNVASMSIQIPNDASERPVCKKRMRDVRVSKCL